MDHRRLVNAITLSRIPASLLLILVFQPEPVLFWSSIAITAYIFFTDIADGYLARRYQVATVMGRHWDSLGDKSFYVAIVVIFLTHGLMSPILAWGLLVREIALYITRILFIENIEQVELIRPYTNWHGYFMYMVIAVGYLAVYSEITGWGFELYWIIQLFALVSLAFGVASIFKYMSLESKS